MNINAYLVIKVHCSYNMDFPSDKNRERVCKMIDESGLFEFVGQSRIDGFNMYKLKDFVKRLGKLQKIKKITPTVMDKLEKLMDKIDNDIEVIPVVLENV